MNCPKCNQSLEVHLNDYREEGVGYEQLEFRCPSNHEYFARIKEEDLIEVD